jgi:uncharacterized RDD family membrane protein YckC
LQATADTIEEITTPEGLVLRFRVSMVAERIMAFALDLLFIGLIFLAAMILALVLGATAALELGVAAAMIFAFLLRHWYFTYFELRGSGVTPGKRNQRLRVIAQDGGPLTGEMIVARNLLRDIEFFLPIVALMAPEALVPGGRGPGTLLAISWLLVFLLFPLFNRRRLRCGDLVAGTIVVREPESTLLFDVAETRKLTSIPSKAPTFTFTTEQLSHYGIKELQVLEDLFRRREEGRVDAQVFVDISGKVQKKIDWPSAERPTDHIAFLTAFYKAQRAHLERELLLGRRKESKQSPTS